MKFIKETSKREKNMRRCFRWSLLICLLHVLFAGIVFVFFVIPQAASASVHSVSHAHSVDRSALPSGQGQAARAARKSTLSGCDEPDDEPDEDGPFRSYAALRQTVSRHECETPQSAAPAPDLAIAKTTEAGDAYVVGQTVTFDLVVTNVSHANVSGAISVVDQVPTGLSNLTVDGGGSWKIVLPARTSPVEIDATYKGPLPVVPGQQLPPIKVRGVLTEAAMPGLTNVATVSTPDDSNPSNNTARKAVFVERTTNIHVLPKLPLTGSDPR